MIMSVVLETGMVDGDHVSIMLFAMFLAQIRRCSLVVPVGGT